MEIEEFEIGTHCFGDYLTVNGKDFEDLDKRQVLDFVINELSTSINKEYFLQKIFSELLEDLGFEIVEDSHDSCEQCGNFNSSTKYKKQ